ncbi:TerC family protein [Deinococcus sp. HMF7604]|uniref:TerC family protein n=1 Tax=Deinococcus betulae TaxID=2873312 RepID=UPI001CC91C43|nr:TerC family protein [Deinococcus betulae]MBZ9751101.1 TerC family protein [Deinococcus betulae]
MADFVQALSSPSAWVGVLSLTLLELVLGIDNVVFITLLASRLPASQQALARTVGLTLAVVTRVALLSGIAWLTRLQEPLLTVLGQGLSVRDLILIGGGLFLMVKSVRELSRMAADPLGTGEASAGQVSLLSVILQIPLIDVVFSLDSVITAIGISGNVPVMVTAVVLAMVVMVAASGPISRYLDAHPPLKLLAAAFLLLVGTNLVAEAFEVGVPSAYLYFTMLFAGVVMLFTVRAARTVRAQAVSQALEAAQQEQSDRQSG